MPNENDLEESKIKAANTQGKPECRSRSKVLRIDDPPHGKSSLAGQKVRIWQAARRGAVPSHSRNRTSTTITSGNRLKIVNFWSQACERDFEGRKRDRQLEAPRARAAGIEV